MIPGLICFEPDLVNCRFKSTENYKQIAKFQIELKGKALLENITQHHETFYLFFRVVENLSLSRAPPSVLGLKLISVKNALGILELT